MLTVSGKTLTKKYRIAFTRIYCKNRDVFVFPANAETNCCSLHQLGRWWSIHSNGDLEFLFAPFYFSN